MTFKTGTSGCPSGRPKGIIDKRAGFRKLLEPSAPELIAKLIEMAKAGEPTAMRLVIERLIQRIKSDETVTFELPEGKLSSADNLLQIVYGITQAVSAGEMTIEEANKLTEFLKQQRLLIGQAERKKQEEIDAEETKKYWEACFEKKTVNEGS